MRNIYTFYKNVYLLCNYFIFTKAVVSIEISSSYGKKANLLKLRTLLLARHPQYPFVMQLSASHVLETHAKFARRTIIEHKDKRSPSMFHERNYNDNEDFLIFRPLSNHSHPCTS